MRRDAQITLVAACVLAMVSIVSWPALSSEGCSAFRGSVDAETNGQGGDRVGHGFSKGDTLEVTIHQARGQMKEGFNLLEYASPNGSYREITEESISSRTYTVPANTSDYIYLNFGGVLPGVTVTWDCLPAK